MVVLAYSMNPMMCSSHYRARHSETWRHTIPVICVGRGEKAALMFSFVEVTKELMLSTIDLLISTAGRYMKR